MRFRRRIRNITPGRRVSLRDYWLGISNGVLFTLAEAVSDASMVLALFIRELGGPLVLVGLLPSLKNGGWLLPQLLAAGRMQAEPVVMAGYRRSAVWRSIAWCLLTATVFFTEELGATPVLWMVILFYTAYNLFGGTAALAFQVIVAKVIPPARRGSFFGYRNLLGGLAAFFIAAPLVEWLLAANSPLAFPVNFGVLMLIALFGLVLGQASFAAMSEPPSEEIAAPRSAREMVRDVPELLRNDATYRHFILVRLLGRLGTIAEPFYVIYALEVLQVPPRMVGVYLATRTIAAALSNLYWARVADRQGTQQLLAQTNLLAILPAVVALTLPPLHWLFALPADWLAWSFATVFLLVGLSVDGGTTAGLTYLMELVPPSDRARYIGVSNTLLGIATFLPVLGGLLIGLVQYVGLFLITSVASVVTWRLSQRLPEPRQLAPQASGPASTRQPRPSRVVDAED